MNRIKVQCRNCGNMVDAGGAMTEDFDYNTKIFPVTEEYLLVKKHFPAPCDFLDYLILKDKAAEILEEAKRRELISAGGKE